MAAVTDWDRLRSLTAWTPARELGVSLAPVGAGLSRLGDGAYVLTQPINRFLEEGDPDAPFITVVYWASSDGAAQRAALRQLESDDGRCESVPDYFFQGGEAPAYAVLVRQARRQGVGRTAERGTYDADGRFVFKTISLGGLQYFFRERHLVPEEMPFAVAIRLSAP